MIGFPFDSQVTYDEHGTPSFDRAISSIPLRNLITKLFSNGVMPNPSTNLQVVQNDGMTVKVKAGFAVVNGCLKLEETDRTLIVQASSNSYDRIDTVVLRLNDETDQRSLDLAIHQGEPATSPIRPDLTRSGSIYEIGLADLYIAKNTSTISPARISDTRYETSRCGIVSSISQFDTTTLYNQIQSDLTEFKTEEQAQWLDWFNNLQYVLDGDVAGHLQNEIDETNAKIGTTPIPPTLGDSVTGAIDSLNSTINNIIDYTKVTKKLGKWIDGIKDVYQAEFNFELVQGVQSAYNLGEIVPADVPRNQVWLDSGFLQTANGTLPINMTDGANVITTWCENGNLYTKSNTFSGVAYACIKFYK